MDVNIETSWKLRLNSEFQAPYFDLLARFVKQEYKTNHVFPRAAHIFRAFDVCPFGQVKVIILGQDPYHGLGQADGLCFSVPQGVAPPPSLVNIFAEIKSDLNIEKDMGNGDLISWAKQGVLLLNATLTVQAHRAGSHQNRGWERFTDAVIATLSREKKHLVFLLWGRYAQSKASLIDSQRHKILKAPHPSPLSAHRGFFGCKHFSQANLYLTKNQEESIRW